jgi:hypothetical protein
MVVTSEYDLQADQAEAEENAGPQRVDLGPGLHRQGHREQQRERTGTFQKEAERLAFHRNDSMSSQRADPSLGIHMHFADGVHAGELKIVRIVLKIARREFSEFWGRQTGDTSPSLAWINRFCGAGSSRGNGQPKRRF